MYKITKGNKIRSVKISETESKNFYEGETLPADYIPPKSYIDNKIVEEIKEFKYDRKPGGKL
jgi:hypothetical protein